MIINDFSTPILLIVFAIIVLAYTTKGITGSGSAIISVALLSIFIKIPLLVPSIFILDFFANTFLAIKTFKQWDIKKILPLLFVHISMIFVGVFLLKQLSNNVLEYMLAILIVFASIYIPFGYKLNIRNSKRIRIITGFLAGLIGGLFGTSGVFIITYVRTMYKEKSLFRAQVSYIYFIETIARGAFMLYFGLFGKKILVYSLSFAPFMFIGIGLGMFLHNRINEKIFNLIISLFLFISAIILLIK